MSNYARIHNSLDRLFSKSARKKIQFEELRWVVFSDHHRGSRDEADDFVQCESTYLKALAHYQDENYSLMLLGDVDEFWENNVWAPIKAYPEVLKSESQFYKRNQFFRIWGNHDDFWRTPYAFSQFLNKSFPSAKISEQIIFEVMDGENPIGEMLFVHGHQGSKGSDRFAALSRFVVRYVWRFFQKTFKFKLSTPRHDLGLRSVTDHALYHWSEQNKVALVCGHTHQPVFMSGSRLDKIDEELNKTTDPHRIAALKKEMSLRADELTRIQAGITRIPCYFNTGCCSFADGDITGIEIADGEMRLVKWTRDSNKKIVLDRQGLRTIFKSINSGN